jgi:hypothetical protein
LVLQWLNFTSFGSESQLLTLPVRQKKGNNSILLPQAIPIPHLPASPEGWELKKAFFIYSNAGQNYLSGKPPLLSPVLLKNDCLSLTVCLFQRNKSKGNQLVFSKIAGG